MRITLEADFKVEQELEKFRKKVNQQVVKTGLDKRLNSDLNELKSRLNSLINKDIKTKENVPADTFVKAHEITIPKSDDEIIRHIAGIDLFEKFKNKDYVGITDSGIAPVFDRKFRRNFMGKNTQHSMSPGITYRIPMNSYDTFDSQFSKAKKYFNESVFVFFDENGQVNYYLNPGLDISQYIKIVCSNQTGDTQRSRDKFEQYKDRTEHADWTVLKEGLDYIQDNFIHLNPIIDKIKEGSYEEARGHLRAVKDQRGIQNSNNNFEEKVKQLENREELAPSVETYSRIISLINNLKIMKSLSENTTTYSLVSSEGFGEGKFFDLLKSTISFWKIERQQFWFNTLVAKAKKLIKEMEAKS